LSLFVVLLSGILLSSCFQPPSGPKVVVYTSVDQVYSEPILKKFEATTGIRVLPVYDVEAAKTTGLVNRLMAEKDRPQADVFWNGEFVQTILLKEERALSPYRSPNGASIPPRYLDPEGYWSGLAGRARVMLVNTKLLQASAYPRSIFDFLNAAYLPDKIGIAYPLFGTAATHAAAIYAGLGPDAGKDFFKKLHIRGVRVVDGNSVVRDLVAGGQLLFGLTDTDDACSAIQKGAPVKMVFPDQGMNGLGTLVVPNTVALIAGAPHSKEAMKLIDFLLSKEVEESLSGSGWSHIALRPVDVQPACIDTSSVKDMKMSLHDIYGQLSLVKKELTEIFIR
jgi:iron(III) transport system substrate-binding protein